MDMSWITIITLCGLVKETSALNMGKLTFIHSEKNAHY